MTDDERQRLKSDKVKRRLRTTFRDTTRAHLPEQGDIDLVLVAMLRVVCAGGPVADIPTGDSGPLGHCPELLLAMQLQDVYAESELERILLCLRQDGLIESSDPAPYFDPGYMGIYRSPAGDCWAIRHGGIYITVCTGDKDGPAFKWANEMTVWTLTERGWAAARAAEQEQSETGNGAPEENDTANGKTEKDKPPLKQPSDLAIEAYRLFIGFTDNQTEIARLMSDAHHRKIHQGQVSVWLPIVKAFVQANNVLPSVDDSSYRERAPKTLWATQTVDMGERVDPRSPRRSNLQKLDESE